MRNLCFPAPSLRGFPDQPRRRISKGLIWRSLLAIYRGSSAADRFFSLRSGSRARSGLCRRAAAPGEKAVVFEAGLAVGEGGAGQSLDPAAGGFENGLA